MRVILSLPDEDHGDSVVSAHERLNHWGNPPTKLVYATDVDSVSARKGGGARLSFDQDDDWICVGGNGVFAEITSAKQDIGGDE